MSDHLNSSSLDLSAILSTFHYVFTYITACIYDHFSSSVWFEICSIFRKQVPYIKNTIAYKTTYSQFLSSYHLLVITKPLNTLYNLIAKIIYSFKYGPILYTINSITCM